MLRHSPTAISCVLLLATLVLAAPAHAATSLRNLGILWSSRLEQPALAPPLADRDRVYLALRSNRVIALALADGRQLWSIDLPLTSGLALDGERLFAVASDALVAIDAATGAIRWRTPLRGGSLTPAARGGWVLLPEGSELRAFRAVDGHLVWRQALGAELAARVTVDGDRLYVPLADSTLAALDVLTGTIRWRVKTPAVPGAVTAAGDRLFLGCADDFFYSLDAKDGDRRWRWRAAADVLAPAAHDGERVYFTALDNVVRAVAFDSGVQQWRHAMDVRPLVGPTLDDASIVLAAAGELRVVETKTGTLAGRWPSPAELAVPPLLLPSDSASGARAIMVTGAATGDWRVYVLAPSPEPELAPLKEIPGRPLSPEGPPIPPAPLPPGA